MKILFAASECMPFVKTGGLADVIGALPKEIIKTGADIRVILPLYRAIGQEVRERLEHVTYFYINLGWRRQYVGIEKLVNDGVTFYFIDNEQYFNRDYIYGKGGDEGERFAFFSKAVLEAISKIDFVPDILNCHDWQTGLIPVLFKAQYQSLPLYKDIKTVFTIHNLQFQGLYPIHMTEELLSLGDWAYTADNLEFYGQASFIKGGIVFADRVTTVSPTYAEEILSPYYGERLDGLLRSRKPFLSGILNGIDTIEYDPENDALIDYNYTAETFEVKVQNKLALQKELGLNEDANAPVIGIVSRLSSQKGLDLIERVLDGIMATGAQLVVLGMGESKYVDLFGWAQWKYAGRLAACFQMNHGLAHRIYAGCDLFLMPSMFEPCGLSQLISLRYGTLPIVRETGGLRDTVLSYNEFTGEGNGFSFFNYNAHDMLYVIERAVDIYKNKRDVFNMLAVRAMKGEYGWDQSAKKYLALYESILEAEKTEEVVEEPAAEPAVEEVKAEEKPKRKPRAKKAPAAEEAAAEEKPKRKPRAKKAAEPKAE
ncbi:MAG: glycogen synthase GlgA [Clostridiales bacterium]|nr:glycogen synthase GlgA [Clostridiales bacterium]